MERFVTLLGSLPSTRWAPDSPVAISLSFTLWRSLGGSDFLPRH